MFKIILKRSATFAAGALAALAVVWGVWGSKARSADGKTQAADAGHSGGGGGHGAPGAHEGESLWHCGMHPWVIQDHPGDCPVCHMKLTPMHSDSPSEGATGQKKLLYWWDPMLGPSSISDKPGKSAMGMDLVPVYADEAGPKVTIDPTVVQNMGVRTARVTRGPLTKTVRTVGLLKTPETGMYDVSLKVGGWIDRLDANQEGMHVMKGEPLLALYGQDLQVAEEELISAVKAGQALGADAGPALRRDAQSLVESARRKLRLWDVAEEDIDEIAGAASPPKDVPFRSPATGHVVEKMVVQGTAVQPGMKLMRIEDHTKMWLDAQVYEEQLPLVKIGQEILATVDGVPGKTFKGTITFMYPHLDHATRTLTVRMSLDNAGFELKPGMYATADVLARPLDDAIQVPREAVIDTGTRQIVFVAEGDGHFDPRRVKMGMTGGEDRVQIVEGVAPGETVVTSGQFLMDVESRTTEAINKLRRAPGPAGDPAAGDAPMGAVPGAMSGAAEGKTRPATAPSADSLSVAYCPMKKTSWLQPGEQIANPYTGTSMPGCGEITRKVIMPPAGSDLAGVVPAYLAVAGGLDADRLDAAAVAALKAAADALPAGKFVALEQSAAKLAEAGGTDAARVAFATLSADLIAAVGPPAR